MRRAFATAALLLAPLTARAEDHVDLKTAYFVEPASAQRLHVIHPQANVNVDFGTLLSVRVGWDADIVTGATPRTYQKVDAVSNATQFSDVRNVFHGGAELHLGAATVGAGYSYGFEHDYRSHVVDGSARVDLFGHNTTFALSYSHNFDSVCDKENGASPPLQRASLDSSEHCFQSDPNKPMDNFPGMAVHDLAIDAYQASWSQVVTPKLLTQISAGLEVLDGFQSNPYRRVRLFDGAAEAQEAHPTLRQRANLTARAKWAIPIFRAAVGLMGRFYWDTWGIKSGTAEVEVDHHFTERLLFRLRGRFYQQTRALFYRDAEEVNGLSYEAVGPVGQYFTGDREMSPFRNWLIGMKISYAVSAGEKGRLLKLFNDCDLSIKGDLIKYDPLTPHPPNADRAQGLLNAIILQAGFTGRF